MRIGRYGRVVKQSWGCLESKLGFNNGKSVTGVEIIKLMASPA